MLKLDSGKDPVVISIYHTCVAMNRETTTQDIEDEFVLENILQQNKASLILYSKIEDNLYRTLKSAGFKMRKVEIDIQYPILGAGIADCIPSSTDSAHALLILQLYFLTIHHFSVLPEEDGGGRKDECVYSSPHGIS